MVCQARSADPNARLDDSPRDDSKPPVGLSDLLVRVEMDKTLGGVAGIVDQIEKAIELSGWPFFTEVVIKCQR